MQEKCMAGDYAALAAEFDVKVPSVYGWIDNGRIAKTKLPKLVEWSGKKLEWWLGTTEPTPAPTKPFSAHAIIKLQSIGENLSESDWKALIQVAQQLASKHAAAPTSTGTPEEAPPSPALKQLFKRKAVAKTADFAEMPNAVTPQDEPPSRALQTQTGHK
jgi:hypothetical protein